MGLYVLRFCFWVQVKVRVKGWVGLMSTAQLRLDLQRWFLDTRVGRIHRWHKSQCDHELLSAQMLHRFKKKQTKTSVIDVHSRLFDSFRIKNPRCSFLRYIYETAPPAGAQRTCFDT